MESLRNSEFQLTVFGFKINQIIAIVALTASTVLWIYFRFFKTNVHFESHELEKNMTLMQLHKLRVERNQQKREESYCLQFSEQSVDEAAISEDEYIMKKVFEKLDDSQNEEVE